MIKLIKPKSSRPQPPEKLGQFTDRDFIVNSVPAPEVLEWVHTRIISPEGQLHNEDHLHLVDADLRFLWAASGFVRAGRSVIGLAEQVAFRCNTWQKDRQVQQMNEWFGHAPAFLITLDASYCRQCTDAEFCALVEHELYHVAQALDEYGQLAFHKDSGLPKLELRGHDVEEFVGVVRRYGVGNKDGAVAQLVAAAGKIPEVAGVDIARACGACMLRAA